MKIIFIALLSITSLYTLGQVSIGLIAEPALNITRIGSEPKTLADSFENIKSYDYTVSFGIEIKKNIDRYQSFSIVPGFHQTNFLTQLEGLQFLDVVHPQLPVIRDLAFAANKRAEIRYRQMYIGSQFLYSRKLQVRGLSSKMGIYLGGGLGAYALISQDAKVSTEGFAIEGKYTHILKNDISIESKSFLLQALVNADYTYEVLPKTDVLAGVKIVLPMTATTSSQPKMTIWAPALRFGIRRAL